jgi:hypothetical protein
MKRTLRALRARGVARMNVLGLVVVLATPITIQAQTTKKISTLMVGGFPLRLGMTTQELLSGIGKAFQYVFSEQANVYFIKQPDGRAIATADIRQGRVISLSKEFELDDSNDIAALATRAYKDFESLRATSQCSTILFAGAKTPAGQMVSFNTRCGNVTLSAHFFTDNESKSRPYQTGFSIYIDS